MLVQSFLVVETFESDDELLTTTYHGSLGNGSPFETFDDAQLFAARWCDRQAKVARDRASIEGSRVSVDVREMSPNFRAVITYADPVYGDVVHSFETVELVRPGSAAIDDDDEPAAAIDDDDDDDEPAAAIGGPYVEPGFDWNINRFRIEGPSVTVSIEPVDRNTYRVIADVRAAGYGSSFGPHTLHVADILPMAERYENITPGLVRAVRRWIAAYAL